MTDYVGSALRDRVLDMLSDCQGSLYNHKKVALEYVQGSKIICSFTLNKFNNIRL